MIHDILLRESTIFYSEQERLVDDPDMITFENVRFQTYSVEP